MKYGANRIAAGIAIIFVLFLSGFYFIDAEKKRNDNILISVTDKGYDLMPSRFIPLQEKARFLIIMERKSPGSMMNYLKGLTNSEEQIDLAIKCYDQLLHFDNKFNGTIKSELIRFLGNSLKDHNDSHPEDLIEYIQELNLLTAVLSYDYYYNSPQEALDLLVDLNQGIYERIKTALGNNNLIPAAYINRSMQFYLTFNNPTNDEVGEIITLINPFEDGSSKDRFNSIYPAGELSRNGRVSINHNGGYHLLASLFATIGDQHNINRSLDSLATAKDYYIGLPFNGPANILGYLYQYHHEDLLNSTITRIAKHSGLSPLAIRRDLIDRSGYLKHLFSSNINATISESNAGYYGPNLIYLSTDIFDRLIDETRLEIEKIKNNDERHYQLALLNKQAAIFRFKLNYDKGLATEDINSDLAFGNFIDNYRAISDSYLAGQVPLTYRYYGGGLRQRNESRKHILLYPDYIGGFFSNTYHTTSFVNYLYENNLVNELYTGSDIEQFNYWLANAHEIYSFIAEEVFKNEYPIGIEELERLRSIIASHPNGNDFNQNLMTLLLVNKYFETDNQKMAIEVAKGLDLSEYDKSAKQFEYLNEAFFLNQVREYASNLALIGEYEKSIEQLETFNRDYHKIQAYVLTANTIYENSYDPITFDLLDTAYSYRSKINEATLNPREEYRDNVIRTLALIGGGANEILINEELKQIFEGIKPAYIERKAFSYALGKDYYAALRAVDADLTEAGELRSYYYILLADLLHYDSKGNNGQWHAMKKYVDHALNYKFNVRGL